MLTSHPNVEIKYDKSHDVLYIHIGEQRPSVGEFSDTLDSVVYKYAMDNDELVGIVVMSFSKLDKHIVEKQIPFPVSLDKFS